MSSANQLPEEEHAECRNCGMILRGKPYYMGGSAYHPRTGKQCKVNHYGGFVCSYECDYRASVHQLDSMPGCAGAKRPDCYAAQTLRRNWPEQYT
jgi:hypothetical protein